MEKKIDFYFDVISPYSYFASKLIGEVVKKHNAILNWKPVLLGGIFKAIGSPIAPGLVPEKKPYLIKDLERLSNYYEIDFKMPSEPIFSEGNSLKSHIWSRCPSDHIPSEHTSMHSGHLRS